MEAALLMVAVGGWGGWVLSLPYFLWVRQPFALAAFGRQI